MTTTTERATALGAIVDLDRYPVHALDTPEGRDLVELCRTRLAAAGACDLEGFLLPHVADAIVAEAVPRRDEGFRTEAVHTIYFDRPLGDEAPEGDPRRSVLRTSKVGLAYDQIPAESPLRALYESEELTRFLSRALEIEPLYRHGDELGALNVMLYGPGDELGWHFDGADFVVTLMLQPSAAGGAFEFVPMLRTAEDENHAGVNRLLAGDRTGIRGMSAERGTLALFRGHRSPHRVTPIEGDTPRVNAVLSYADRPDARLSTEIRRLFYGRTD
jgi:2OG-Fe(II) oxygenase superfamily